MIDVYLAAYVNLQLYISRGSIDTFSLVSDAAYISASLARIMRALFEICLRGGWCEMSLFMLEYCKAVDRQIWPHQHPLRQFDKDLSAEVCLAYFCFVFLSNYTFGENCLIIPLKWYRYCGSLKNEELT